MSIVQKLTEGIVNRDLAKEGEALLNKWSSTGLLEGLGDDRKKSSMARLLENQAKELLREASTMSAGDVEGFAAVAFPIVRRVFAGLIANDLVSVQPMSLPSGLIFFLDFTFNSSRLGNVADASLYGGNVVAAGLTGGVDLSDPYGERSFYNLNNGYASPTGSITMASGSGIVVASGYTDNGGTVATAGFRASATGWNKAGIVRFDPDVTSGSAFAVVSFPLSQLETAAGQFNQDDLIAISASVPGGNEPQIRRLTRIVRTGDADYVTDGRGVDVVLFTLVQASPTVPAAAAQLNISASAYGLSTLSVPIKDNLVQFSEQLLGDLKIMRVFLRLTSR